MQTKYLIRFINFLLYSYLFVALCAVALTYQTIILLQIPAAISSNLLGLVFFSTWLIYAGHRYVSLAKAEVQVGEAVPSRLAKVRTYRQVFPYLAMVASGAILYFGWGLSLQAWYTLPIAGGIAGAYVLPVWKGYRLRDLPFVKIFMVAVVWAYVTVVLPVGEVGLLWSSWWWVAIERMVFIFAITLPFDLRDIAFDKTQGVRTIATSLGMQGTVWLSLGLLVLWLGLVLGLYAMVWWWSFVVTALITIGLVYWSPRFLEKDWYFTGLLDGMMLLQPVLIVLMS